MLFKFGICVGTVLATLLATAAGALASPLIDGESVFGITETDATLQALINPQSQENGALYQFQVVESGGAFASRFACPIEEHSSLCIRMESVAGALPWYVTAPAMEDKTVSLDLTQRGMALEPGTTYDYRVIAAEDIFGFDVIEWAEPIVYGKRQSFTTASLGEAPPSEEEPPTTEEDLSPEPERTTGGSVEQGQLPPAPPPDPEVVNPSRAPSVCRRVRHHRSHRHHGLHVAHARKICDARRREHRRFVQP